MELTGGGERESAACRARGGIGLQWFRRTGRRDAQGAGTLWPRERCTTMQAKRRFLCWLYGLAAVLFAITLCVEFRVPSRYALRSEWVLILPALQVCGTAAIAASIGRPREWCWLHAALALGFAGLLSGLIAAGEFQPVLFRALAVGLRVGLPACWILAVGGLAGFGYLLRRRKTRVLKWCVAAAAALIVAEPAAWLLERSHNRTLDLPARLPPAPEAEIHIAVVGGSSALGHPYQPKFGFPQVVAWRVRRMYPGRTVVLHNLAKGGAELREAAGELKKLPCKPHVLLLYSGHNEFLHDMDEFATARTSPLSFLDGWLRWSPAFRVFDRWVSRHLGLWEMRRGSRSFIEPPIASPGIYGVRLERFRRQLQELADFGDRLGIGQVWLIPAASESGFEPNRSCVAPGTTDEERAALQRQFDRARTSDCGEALAIYQEALSRHPECAELHFRMAECLVRLERYDEARRHFIDALRFDGHPIRTNRDYCEAIRGVAARNGIAVVETARELRPHAAHGILGDRLFHDNVHMTLSGYYLTGMAAARRLREAGLLEAAFGEPHDPGPASFSEAVRASGLTWKDLATACRRTAFGLKELARWRFDEQRRLRESARYERLARLLDEGTIQPGEEGTERLP